MLTEPNASFDVAVVGAGPVGSLCALAHAKQGAHVGLIEANPKASGRLAGEWLHPPAVKLLRKMGIDPDRLPNSKIGLGFVVYPEDGSEPILLPYPDGSRGIVCDHSQLVASIGEAVDAVKDIELIAPARVKDVSDNCLTYAMKGEERSLSASRIVGADGRASVVRQSLGLSTRPMLCSRMLSVSIPEAELPFDGFGHVFLGGPGPLFVYSLEDGCVRIIVDVPVDRWPPKDRLGFLSESYAGLLPDPIGTAFVDSLRAGNFHAAVNQLRPRVIYGSSQRVLIGDAAGHYHPMTAVGMTLGFGDAVELAESQNFKDYVSERLRAVRVPEFLAMGLYEVFADHRAEAVVLREAVYQGWRTAPGYRELTTRILACEDRSTTGIAIAGAGIVVRAMRRVIPTFFRGSAARQRSFDVFRALIVRLWWLQRGFLQLRRACREGREEDQRARQNLSRALLHSIPNGGEGPLTVPHKDVQSPDAEHALRSATKKLLALQRPDGAWEGEMVWCPMLTAQYVLLHHVIGQPMEEGRRRRALRSFERTQLEGGVWGMHDHAPPSLFVTTLVYIASRSLGIASDDPMISRARDFIRSEDILRIPSWGKFWLAVLNLYEWQGVNAILPELWALPRWLPLHPSNWYCHTRLIYMAMSSIYAKQFQIPNSPLVVSLREELFPRGFNQADFVGSRTRLREGDLFAAPSIWLKFGYRVARLFERIHRVSLRQRCEEAILEQIKWELRTTNHTSISPVSGILNILARWLHDPNDEDSAAALAKLNDWIWEDEEDGARVCGARSASWDTGFALQALATLPKTIEVRKALSRGTEFLMQERIDHSFEGFREAYRSDPMGGWCFAGGWHGWPVSDCTAEAVAGLIAANGGDAHRPALVDALGFILRSQNRDGGFGSYESRRSMFGLEWLNPAEMFGDSMTEHSFVECTASCLAALTACRDQFPEIANAAADRSILRAEDWLRQTQESDGAWRGVWGVQFIYGTMFGIRGLVMAGACPGDSALRSACRWLLDRQRHDGGWGEHHSGCLTGKYVEHEQSQVIQTAWALMGLLEAGEPDWAAITRGAKFLLDTQDSAGAWPKQDMVGVFFRTALLDYVLYRQYFPLHALGLYQQRRQSRMELILAPTAEAA